MDIVLVEDDKNVVVKNKDTGIGIPQEDQNKIFGKFERAKNAINMYTDGSGLGLYITKAIIEAHAGAHVGFRSEEEQGAEFMLTFAPIKLN